MENYSDLLKINEVRTKEARTFNHLLERKKEKKKERNFVILFIFLLQHTINEKNKGITFVSITKNTKQVRPYLAVTFRGKISWSYSHTGSS